MAMDKSAIIKDPAKTPFKEGFSVFRKGLTAIIITLDHIIEKTVFFALCLIKPINAGIVSIKYTLLA